METVRQDQQPDGLAGDKAVNFEEITELLKKINDLATSQRTGNAVVELAKNWAAQPVHIRFLAQRYVQPEMLAILAEINGLIAKVREIHNGR